jgi:methylase of polypeptide subunit release factors
MTARRRRSPGVETPMSWSSIDTLEASAAGAGGPHTRADLALLKLGRLLRASKYSFRTITPESHRRVNLRAQSAEAHSVVDVFGWSRPFAHGVLPEATHRLLDEAGMLTREGDLLRSQVRFSTLEDLLFAHSSFPTTQEDSVFFGPDTYRFARFIESSLRAYAIDRSATVVDIGCGSGAGGLVVSRCMRAPPQRLVLSDISVKAVRFARINASINAVPAEVLRSDVLQEVDAAPDLIVSNPPYLVDPAHRVYRDGGGALGFDLSLRILQESLDRLAPAGLLILYTGSAIVGDVDQFRAAVAQLAENRRVATWRYEEIDPDVFGEELETAAYAEADRIAAVGLTVRMM